MSDDLTDRMIFDENRYPSEVRMDSDGFYRWRCKLDRYHDRKEYLFIIRFWLIFACAGIIPGVLMGSSAGQAVLYGIAGFAVFLLIGALITGFIRLIDGGPSLRWYRMNDSFVQIQPSGKGSGISYFAQVRKVLLDEAHNEIRLVTRWGNAYLFCRTEDYKTLRSHVLQSVPADAEISGEL